MSKNNTRTMTARQISDKHGWGIQGIWRRSRELGLGRKDRYDRILFTAAEVAQLKPRGVGRKARVKR